MLFNYGGFIIKMVMLRVNVITTWQDYKHINMMKKCIVYVGVSKPRVIRGAIRNIVAMSVSSGAHDGLIA